MAGHSQEKTIIQGLKYRWQCPAGDTDAIRNISHENNLSFPIAQTLYQRGYTDHHQVQSFLFCSFEKDVPHPTLLKGSVVAAQRIIKAIENKEKILVFGDYDVDGVTSSATLLTALIPLGANINYFLPHREKDGYGLSTTAVRRAKNSGYSLIITVDNGITALEPAALARELGIDLIITDHHRPHDKLPDALTIVNPNQDDCPYPFKKLAGVGVIFKIVCLIYEYLGIPQLPTKLYELLMLGTIADVVPLTEENRYWVQYGLSSVNKHQSPALKALMNNAALTKTHLQSLDIGFMIAPQINALGRLDDSRDAVRFLVSSNQDDVGRIAAVLKQMNEDRKKIDQAIYFHLEQRILQKKINLDDDAVILAAEDNWPPGVIGLVAGKLMHNFGRPTLLFHHDKKHNLAKGSCRSIAAFNMFDALTANKDLLLSFGGHSMAAGLKLKFDLLPELKRRLNEQVRAQLTMEELQPKIILDAFLELPEMSKKLMQDMAQLEPFGHHNAQPLFLVKDVSQIQEPQLLKDRHVKCTLFSQGIIKPTMFFHRPDLYPFFQELGDKPFHLACHIMKNEWQGITRLELQGIDIALAT